MSNFAINSPFGEFRVWSGILGVEVGIGSISGVLVPVSMNVAVEVGEIGRDTTAVGALLCGVQATKEIVKRPTKKNLFKQLPFSNSLYLIRKHSV